MGAQNFGRKFCVCLYNFLVHSHFYIIVLGHTIGRLQMATFVAAQSVQKGATAIVKRRSEGRISLINHAWYTSLLIIPYELFHEQWKIVGVPSVAGVLKSGARVPHA